MKTETSCPTCQGKGKIRDKEQTVLVVCGTVLHPPIVIVDTMPKEGRDLVREGELYAQWLYANCPWTVLKGIHQFLEPKHKTSKDW